MVAWQRPAASNVRYLRRDRWSTTTAAAKTRSVGRLVSQLFYVRLCRWLKCNVGSVELAMQELPEIFWLPHIISGTSKATDFKFGRCIHKVHPSEQKPIKIMRKGSMGVSRTLQFIVYIYVYMIPLYINPCMEPRLTGQWTLACDISRSDEQISQVLVYFMLRILRIATISAGLHLVSLVIEIQVIHITQTRISWLQNSSIIN